MVITMSLKTCNTVKESGSMQTSSACLGTAQSIENRAKDQTMFFHESGHFLFRNVPCKGKGSPNLTAEHRVPELIPVLGSQPAGDVSHKSGDRLPLLSARHAVTLS